MAESDLSSSRPGFAAKRLRYATASGSEARNLTVSLEDMSSRLNFLDLYNQA